MSKFSNLSAQDQAKVTAKLAELEHRTGRSWSCEVMMSQRDSRDILEATVDGRILKPVILDGNDDAPADRICSELDSFRP